MKNIRVRNVDNILNDDKINLTIPDYQRPYCWSRKSVRDLLNDIQDTYEKCKTNKDYKYRIGTIILYCESKENNIYEIVDGQQRIITLSLIKYVFNSDSGSFLLDKFKFSDKKTINNIIENEKVIRNWYDGLPNKRRIKGVFNNNLEFLVVVVNNIDEAFQLFDSQNTSGKELYPHDLLKAFHLREMELNSKDRIYEKVKQWENEDSKNIASLFKNYLYPIKCWSKKEATHTFSSNDIDEYKGITNSIREMHGNYNYYKMFNNETYQIDLPFYSGTSFFEMVNYYLKQKRKLIEEIKTIDNDIYLLVKNHLDKKISQTEYDNSPLKEAIGSNLLGMKYTCQLFFAALLFYYDRFNYIDKTSLYKLFTWAFMLRIDLESINMKSINLYALGIENINTTNNIPMFYLIANFKNHFELYDVAIEIKQNEDNWIGLYNFISNLDNDEEEKEYE